MRLVYEEPSILVDVFDKVSVIATSTGGTQNGGLQIEKETPEDEKQSWGALF